MSNNGGCNSRAPVKVVIINTQYVQTDATSFKSVVQKLTGKDSDSDSDSVVGNNKTQKMMKRHHGGVVEVPPANELGRSFLTRDLSFKEFDRLLNEMPPLNDMLSDYC